MPDSVGECYKYINTSVFTTIVKDNQLNIKINRCCFLFHYATFNEEKMTFQCK